MSKDVNSLFDSEARASEREARTAKEAETAYEASRSALENARSYAKDGVDLSVETLGRHSRALDTSR